MEINENFEYPLLPEWNTQEIIVASEFYEAVEKVYINGISRSEFLEKYNRFLAIEPAIMTQKQLDRAFSEASGLSIYRAVQFVKNSQAERIKFTEKS